MKLRIKLRVKQLKFQIYFHNIQVSYLLHIIWKQILLNYSTSSTPSMIEISFRGSQKDCDGGIKLHSNVFDTFVLKFDTHENKKQHSNLGFIHTHQKHLTQKLKTPYLNW